MMVPRQLRQPFLAHHCKWPHNLSKLLRRCTAVPDLFQLHAAMIKTAIDFLPFPAAKLIASASIIDSEHAFSLFPHLSSPNLFSFNCILRAHSVAPEPDLTETFQIFNSIRFRSLPLDQFSFITTLKVCSRKLAMGPGEQLHGLIANAGFDQFLNLRNTLLHFYCSCKRIADAHKLFDELPQRRDSLSFCVLIGGYLRTSQPSKMGRGDQFHCYCIKAGIDSGLKMATAVATMYVKQGTMESARQLFEEMPSRDVVLYNCIVDGYAKQGSLDECLALLQQMKADGLKPNASTLVGLLAACASSGELGIGQRIHACVEMGMMEMEASLGTAFIDMYSKNGCLEEAISVFGKMEDRDVKAWTAMIMGLGLHGRSEDALQLFDEMTERGVRPNEVTLLAVLSACSHGGLVSLGKDYFKRIVQEYQLSPRLGHYGCLIDLLGRAGLLEEAYELVRSLPDGGDAMAWRALLAACRVHGEVRIGVLARERMAAMGEEHPTDGILLSSSYAFAGRWPEALMARDSELAEKMKSKEAGCSSIELDGSYHESSDLNHIS